MSPKIGMYYRCPYDREDNLSPRRFILGQVESVNEVADTVVLKICDPFHYKNYYDDIESTVTVSSSVLYRSKIFKNSPVLYKKRKYEVISYQKNEDGFFTYYLQDAFTKEYVKADETDIIAPFTSGDPDAVTQLMRYEFQNPCWYMGRRIVKRTTDILDNSIYGFKQLAGCKIFLKSFQLETIMRCLQTDPCRYMIADEVGLGKTIEAASVLKIYLSNKHHKKVLIIVPSALEAQWKSELVFKFDLLEGENENFNTIIIKTAESLSSADGKDQYDFLIVDEIHNYIHSKETYPILHSLSLNAENVLLLSATPIQQRKEEYLNLLRLILPEKYDDMDLPAFSELTEKQSRIASKVSFILDDIEDIKADLLPDILDDERDPHDDEDVNDMLDGIEENFGSISEMLNDKNLDTMIDQIDRSKKDLGFYDMQVVISYICDNYQLESNIIRGRRAIIKDEFSKRQLDELSYELSDDENFYENDAYYALTDWVKSLQGSLTPEMVRDTVQPLLMAFFSSPWAYEAELKHQKSIREIPSEVIKAANSWRFNEDDAVSNLADILDEPETHPSRLIKIISYIDLKLLDSKVVLFTDFPETFDHYYYVLKNAYQDAVVAFGDSIEEEERERNIYRFQTDPECMILLCDKSGGEGRNLQNADYLIHIDLPWDINRLEQRIGRLDRLGRNVTIPVTSVVVHSNDSYESQLFIYWNEGLNVFSESLSGLEIIMSDINRKLTDSIQNNFEYGLEQLIPELIEETKHVRQEVQKEQIFDTAAKKYKPLYIQMKKLLSNYQFNENDLFHQTMMSWAALSGFTGHRSSKDRKRIRFDSDSFSLRSAYNSFLIPPDWDNYFNKKQNEISIRVIRGVEESKEKNVVHSTRYIEGTFDRNYAIQSDYIHFFAPGDEIFDCIVNNALWSARGKATAFCAESSLEWRGFVFTYTVEPNIKKMIDAGVPSYAVSMFRSFLASPIRIVPVPFSSYGDIQAKDFFAEYNRIISKGYFGSSKDIEHLGRRGKSGGSFLEIKDKYNTSNLEWFKAIYPEENWKQLVINAAKVAKTKALKEINKESRLEGAKNQIETLLSAKEASNRYYGRDNTELDTLRKQYEVIYDSLKNPSFQLDSLAFVWLHKVVKDND